MMSIARISGHVLLAMLAVGQALPARAENPRDPVARMLSATGTVLRDPTADPLAREHRVRDATFEAFHFDEMARRSLGAHWENLSPVQQEEFVRVFGAFFERTFSRLVLLFMGERRTRFVEERIIGSVGVVNTLVERPPDEPLPVTYMLAYTHERWGIVDVVLNGLSIAQSYRVKFDEVIRGSSYETLVQLMRARAG
jgi:phospholipid transport system substrate-binding protein